MTFTGLLLSFKSCLIPCMFTGLSVSCKKIRVEKAAPQGQQGAAIEFTVPPGQNFMLFKPKADQFCPG